MSVETYEAPVSAGFNSEGPPLSSNSVSSPPLFFNSFETRNVFGPQWEPVTPLADFNDTTFNSNAFGPNTMSIYQAPRISMLGELSNVQPAATIEPATEPFNLVEPEETIVNSPESFPPVTSIGITAISLLPLAPDDVALKGPEDSSIFSEPSNQIEDFASLEFPPQNETESRSVECVGESTENEDIPAIVRQYVEDQMQQAIATNEALRAADIADSRDIVTNALIEGALKEGFVSIKAIEEPNQTQTKLGEFTETQPDNESEQPQHLLQEENPAIMQPQIDERTNAARKEALMKAWDNAATPIGMAGHLPLAIEEPTALTSELIKDPSGNPLQPDGSYYRLREDVKQLDELPETADEAVQVFVSLTQTHTAVRTGTIYQRNPASEEQVDKVLSSPIESWW